MTSPAPPCFSCRPAPFFAYQGFRATFQRPELSEAELAAAVGAPEPPFTLLTVADLLPAELREGYAAAGGEAW